MAPSALAWLMKIIADPSPRLWRAGSSAGAGNGLGVTGLGVRPATTAGAGGVAGTVLGASGFVGAAVVTVAAVTGADESGTVARELSTAVFPARSCGPCLVLLAAVMMSQMNQTTPHMDATYVRGIEDEGSHHRRSPGKP